jgi:hypothetical protein
MSGADALCDAVNFYLPHLEATNRSCTASQLVAELLSIKAADGASGRYISDGPLPASRVAPVRPAEARRRPRSQYTGLSLLPRVPKVLRFGPPPECRQFPRSRGLTSLKGAKRLTSLWPHLEAVYDTNNKNTVHGGLLSYRIAERGWVRPAGDAGDDKEAISNKPS